MQQIKRSKRALWNPDLYLHSGMQSRYKKKKISLLVIHMSTLRKSSMPDYWSLRLLIQTPSTASVGMFGSSHYRRSIWITVMQRQLVESQTMAHYWKFIQLLTCTSRNFRMSTDWKNSWLSMRQNAHFKSVYSFMFISKEISTNME